MKINILLVFISSLSGFFPVSGFTTEKIPDRETSAKAFSLHLGATRVIYSLESPGATLTVINNHNYPMLVQSVVLTEGKQKYTPFIVTPPLFRLDALQSSRLKVIRTGGDFPNDRESIQWLCVKGIPPKEDDKWAEDQKIINKVSLHVQFSINNCVKLFIRPESVKGHPDDVAGKIEWHKIGNKIKGVNPTPFYMNLSEISVGTQKVNEHNYISPYSSTEYTIPASATGKISWRVITDYGGLSKQYEAQLK
ncbi:fimbria/pilus periplasmic chaperone [Escherichia coli]|nr:fimbria/pilus periplasmic chaperone [Escherichia coli]